jgi:hypothetical protein
MMADEKDDRASVGRRWDNGLSENPLKPTLSEVGIDKNLANRALRARRGPATLRATAAFI